MVFLLLTQVYAQNPWKDASFQDLQEYARALSLDIRADVLTKEELLEIEANGFLSDVTIESWLYSDGFTQQVIRQQQALVWNNLSVQIARNRRLTTRNGYLYNPTRYNVLRGSRDCGDFEATVNELNQPTSYVTVSDTEIQEGYVWVEPYWDMENPVPVCAFDAQTTEISSSGNDCSTSDGQSDPECGCGPNLQWCFRNTIKSVFEDSFEQEVEERVKKMLDEELSYQDFLVSPFGHINGPMVHFFTYLAPFDRNIESPIPIEELPDLTYTDEQWLEIAMSEHSAGLLTSPAWLLRHQTNRGRANRIYSGFLCQEFIPVDGSIKGTTSLDTPTPDLSTREGCRDCHARLDPWASYWGRWKEGGLLYYPSTSYRSFNTECSICSLTGGCPDICSLYNVSATHSSEDPFIGWFKTYTFLIGGSESNPDLGPQNWTQELIQDQSLTQCSVSTTAKWLLDWEIGSNEDVINAWSEEWSGSDLNYREMVREIITSEYYWRGE